MEWLETSNRTPSHSNFSKSDDRSLVFVVDREGAMARVTQARQDAIVNIALGLWLPKLCKSGSKSFTSVRYCAIDLFHLVNSCHYWPSTGRSFWAYEFANQKGLQLPPYLWRQVINNQLWFDLCANKNKDIMIGGAGIEPRHIQVARKTKTKESSYFSNDNNLSHLFWFEYWVDW